MRIYLNFIMMLGEQRNLLRISNLTVHYGAAQALFGVDLAVGRGETVALVGANGAGKTSLLKAVMGLAPPSGGRIWLDGIEVTGSTRRRPWQPRAWPCAPRAGRCSAT